MKIQLQDLSKEEIKSLEDQYNIEITKMQGYFLINPKDNKDFKIIVDSIKENEVVNKEYITIFLEEKYIGSIFKK